MKSIPGGIGGKTCYKIKVPDLNPYKIRPHYKIKGCFLVPIFYDFGMILDFLPGIRGLTAL